MTASALQWQSWADATESTGSTKPKIVTIWPFIEKFSDSLHKNKTNTDKAKLNIIMFAIFFQQKNFLVISNLSIIQSHIVQD